MKKWVLNSTPISIDKKSILDGINFQGKKKAASQAAFKIGSERRT